MKTRTPVTICSCGHTLDACTGVDHKVAPKPGDLSLCRYCLKLYSFNQELGLEAVSDEEFAALSPDEQLELKRVRRLASLGMPN